MSKRHCRHPPPLRHQRSQCLVNWSHLVSLPKSTKAIGLLPTINAGLGCAVQHTVYIVKCKTQHNALQHALCNTLFTDPVPHAHSYVEVKYMVLVESSSDDFKAV